MQALTTVFTPPSWCANRFAVYIDNTGPGTSTLNPQSGWVDPSFTKCVPTQYTEKCPTFSPGICPKNMHIVTSTSHVHDTTTIWTGGCCQSGFMTIDFDPRFLCTSVISTPMAFLLEPNISTADVYTTLSTSSLMLEHDQMTVEWESTDLPNFPSEVAKSYASIMKIAFPLTTDHASPTIPAELAFPQSTQGLVQGLSPSILPLTTSFQLATGRPASGLAPSLSTSDHLSATTISKSSGRLETTMQLILAGWLGIIWQLC
ncbi:hypothetical protein F4810DRAFT_715901 [Camillea tinctor]|nr:hypothetical protein F4810DRAFT_715901 [Camillea tinctor]